MEKAGIQPIIVDLGSRKKKLIKNLKKGTGKLMVEVELAVEQARATLPDGDKSKSVIPVIIVYRKKSKKGGAKSLPFSPLNPLNFLRC